MTLKRARWAYAILYALVSILIEAGLILLLGLSVPEDNAKIFPVVLTLPPLATAWIAGYRKPRELALLAILSSLFTLAVTLAVVRITGVAAGIIEPIINRSLAGYLAAAITQRVASSERGKAR